MSTSTKNFDCDFDDIKRNEEYIKNLQIENIDLLCVYGIGRGCFYLAIRNWLEEKKERRLIFIEDDSDVYKNFVSTKLGKEIQNKKNISVFFFDQKREVEGFLKKILWENVFRKTNIIAHPYYKKVKSQSFANIERQFQTLILGITLVVSEYKHCGNTFFKNFYTNIYNTPSVRLAENFYGQFSKIPAIICGAGPSLEKHASLLREVKNKALIFAGGTAINILSAFHIPIDISANIEKTHKRAWYNNLSLFETPFFYQKQALADYHGPKFLLGDNESYLLERFFLEKTKISQKHLQCGWNVSTILMELAYLMGCDPIIFVGMDLSFQKDKIYAKDLRKKSLNKKNMITTQDIFGEDVFTTNDLKMAAYHISKFSLEHKNSSFINATEGGIGFTDVPNRSFADVIPTLKHSYDLKGLLHSVIQSLCPSVELKNRKKVLKSFFCSLQACDELCDQTIKSLEQQFSNPDLKEDFFPLQWLGQEAFYLLLQPLWENCWKYIFMQKVQEETALRKISPVLRLTLHKMLFFKGVISQHIQNLMEAKNEKQ